MKKLLLTLTLSFAGMTAFAQNVGINATGAAPDNSAMLDVASTTKGMLVPRMTQSQRNLIGSPVTGLLIYQTDNTPGFYVYSGTAWGPVSSGGGATTSMLETTKNSSSSQIIASGGSSADINYDIPAGNTNFNGTVFTAPSAGVYSITATTTAAATGYSLYPRIDFSPNGSSTYTDLILGNYYASSNINPSGRGNVTITKTLAAGDKIKIVAINAAATSTATLIGGSRTILNIFKL